VKFLRLQFTDISGTIKNVGIPDRQFEEALDGKIMFDGSSIEGFVRIEESDMYLRPDLATFQVFPWTDASGARDSSVGVRATPITVAPSSRRAREAAKPIPRLAPVTTASVSFSRRSTGRT